MMIRVVLLIISIVGAGVVRATTSLTNCAALAALPPLDDRDSLPVELTGVIQTHIVNTNPDEPSTFAYFSDETGSFCARLPSSFRFADGDRIWMRGLLRHVRHSGNMLLPEACRIVGHTTPHEPKNIALREIRSGQHNCTVVTVSGHVLDAFHDEIDPSWSWLILRDIDATAPIAIPGESSTASNLTSIIGKMVSVTGVCSQHTNGRRYFLGPKVSARGWSDLVITDNGDQEEDGVPLNFSEGVLHLRRYSVDGIVLAVWGKTHLLLQSAQERPLEVRLRPDIPAPRSGDRIRATGFAETDTFFIRLVQASYQKRPNLSGEIPPPTDTTARDILTRGTGQRKIEADFHGRLIRLPAIVRATSFHSQPDGTTAYLEHDGFTFSADLSSVSNALERLPPGTTLSLTGVCLMEVDSDNLIAGFPRIAGFSVIVRSNDDIVVLSTPSWWTPARLTIVIVLLVVLMGAVLAWNISLRIVAERRSNELLRQNVARIGAELRTEERTRLAVELHDSLAQMLTGISFQVDAGNMEIVSKSLDTCRDELRNCLWDLRNQTLEDPDIGNAIRKTLEHRLGNVQLEVRFDVPRTRLPDSTAHAVLMIVRELVSNAIRHGHASRVSVIGKLEGELLRIVVQDNGFGFDPDHCPGLAEGHFGLQGVRERANRHNGSLSITSSKGSGTTAVVVLKTEK